MARLTEKIGYGFGDMSSSMFWKVFSYFLPFFYSNIFGLRLADAALLVLVTRLWDAVSDPMMGVIADRTHTRWGKYRPYLLWVAPFFSVCGILLFTTPQVEYGLKLTWAYVTYLLMMTVYTAINVPYGAMLGVMTDDPQEKTSPPSACSLPMAVRLSHWLLGNPSSAFLMKGDKTPQRLGNTP